MNGSLRNKLVRRVSFGGLGTGTVLILAALTLSAPMQAQATAPTPDQLGVCNRTLTANVVALDMPLMWNRLGAQNINGMMYALRRDVVDSKTWEPIGAGGSPGNVSLRPDKRPRPLVLRMGAGDCMTINLTNLLSSSANPHQVGANQDPNGVCAVGPNTSDTVRSDIPLNCFNDDQVAEREISLRFQGTELVDNISDDGSNVGGNGSSLIGTGQSATYTIHAPFDGAFLGVSYGGTIGGEGLGGQTASGLWAVLNVNPKDSAFYRSSVTQEEMDLATTGDSATGHPIINYEAVYPSVEPWLSEGKAGLPVLNMVVASSGEMVHTAIDAIVAYGGVKGFELSRPASGPHTADLGHFPKTIYPLESVDKRNPTVPNRLEPFRELTVAFHDEVQTTQAFPKWFGDPVLQHTLHGVRDSFMINYGSGGIGSEIIANRLRVGPMHDCVNCAYEEFFLTFSAVGEVGQLPDIPANFGLENCDPTLANCEAVGPKANYVLYPEDPSNVHHGYTGDATAFRNLHAGPGEQHVFHLHNNQWLFNADDDNSNYLDAQGLGPGSGYAYWINFGGAGNRNKTSGDAIFHCHFYPHFAQGMWEMWRLHDTFEPGTELQVSVDSPYTEVGSEGFHESFVANGLGIGNGLPAVGARALPDGEIIRGAPTPAVVPLPGRPMPPMPALGVTVVENPNTICVSDYGPTGGVGAKDEYGACPTGFSPRAVGSLTKVDRTVAGGVYGEDGVLGRNTSGQDDGEINPGFPFWIAGMEHTIGSRPPTPPLDMISSGQAAALYNDDPNSLWNHEGWKDTNAIDGWDGGLPRFSIEGYSAGGAAAVAITRLDMSKEIHVAKPAFFPETGTDLEKIAMGHHAQRCHDTSNPDGTPADCPAQTGDTTGYTGYLTNGALPIAGAPFQEPCIDDRGDLMDGQIGDFFGGDGPWAMQDQTGLTTQGKSPFTSTTPRVYKAANVQFDAVFNKLGYHFPQQRIIALWQDVVPTIKQERPPEPFVLRMNTFDCTQFVHSNVVPKTYELDDYQVRTPTDIIGQHIHLPKWDLVSADGSANGWNYEDGTLAPEAVVEMIHAINAWNTTAGDKAVTTYAGSTTPVEKSSISMTGVEPAFINNELHASDHPFFGGTEFAGQWIGARSTLQRWFADPVVNVQGVDRGLGIIFTHDHYGPSTHQQVGLYATVLIEPAGSKWVHNETGEPLYNPAERIDGGPTSWQAAILTGTAGIGGYEQNVGAESIESYREFYMEYTDFQHAYQPGVFVGVGADNKPTLVYDGTDANHDGLIDNPITAANSDTFRDAIQPPVRKQASEDPENPSDFPIDIWEFPPWCTNIVNGVQVNNVPRPCPEAITADDPGMYVVNYRNESLLARVYDPDKAGPDAEYGKDCSTAIDRSGCGTQADGKAGDLAFAMDSNVTRAIPELNDRLGLAPASYNDGVCSGGVFCPPITDPDALSPGDPFTPTMRSFDGDNVSIKMQAGGQEEEHAASVHGLKWLQAGSGFGKAKNSGWRNAQSGGISEQFTLNMPVFADYNQRGNQADYAYTFNGSVDGWAMGTWGVLRTYKGGENNLFALPDNPVPKGIRLSNAKEFSKVCPKTAPERDIDITAVSVNDIFGSRTDITIQDLYPNAHVGASPDSSGGTLVYNPRATSIELGEASAHVLPQGETEAFGPLHDPTGMMYVNTADLVSAVENSNKDNDPYCWRAPSKGNKWKYAPSMPACKVKLRDGAAVEPVVIRAAAGDCMNVTLRNKVLAQAYEDVAPYGYYDRAGGDYVLFQADGKPAYEDKRGKGPQYVLSADTDYDGIGDTAPVGVVRFDQTNDLASGNALPAMVRRDPGAGETGMTSFNNNLLQPSAYVGLHPQLVEYDISRSDGISVGQNNAKAVPPGAQETYQWYAGHIGLNIDTSGAKAKATLVATPIEFGGFNIMPADNIKQGQKGLIGAGVIYPQGSTWVVDANTNTAATVYDSGGAVLFRDFTTVASKGVSMFYKDSFPVENLLGEGTFGVAEDSQDMGHMNINYGNEAMWFRFGKNPTRVAGNADCNGDGGGADGPCLGGLNNASDAFSNTLIGGDPETPVFTATAGQPFRMHVLMPFAAGRGSTYDLHGHVWQRDPYVCEGDSDHGLPGKCDTGDGLPTSGSVASQSLGDNPIGFHLGAIESWFGTQHYEIVIDSAGGSNGIVGDYLFRDHMGLGNAGGLWGILRVSE